MSNGNGNGGTPAQMVFLQYVLPPLKSGNLTVTVTQTVSVAGQGDTFQAQQQLYVAGERYALGQADVNSVFPPAGNQGEFSNIVAHVVLSSATLPWQRSPVAGGPESQPGNPVPTWLAVFLFDQDDPPPKPQTVTLAELASTDTTYFPPRVAEDGEQPTDPVTVIDVPVALFNAIAPSLADLSWTAHVRQVDPTPKSTDGTPPAVDCSVVFGNRLPVAGNTATAHLVSLEGFGGCLPAQDGTPSAAIPSTAIAVRMVTLWSWTFSALDLGQGFAGLLEQVDMEPPVLSLSYDAAKTSGNAQAADTAVQNAFGMGYTALNHDLRNGGTTVSWYRGPLLPLGTPLTAAPPWNDADELVRYDPTNGMFDVSYAAAWQLGHLQALHDAAFSTALYRWKLTQTQAQVTALEQQVIDAALPALPGDSLAAGAQAVSARKVRMATVVRDVVGVAARRLASLRRQE
jgi:hypothetical protein